MLGNSQSKNVLTSSTNGSITVLAPNIKVSTTGIDFGRVPLGTTAEQTVQITNEGNSDLTISSLTFNDAQFSTTEAIPFTISPNGNRNITVVHKPTAKGTLAKQLLIGSNDPDQSASTVTLNAIAYAVNEIHTGSITGASSSSGKLDFTLNNMEDFTGVQFDLVIPQPMTYTSGSAQLFRSQDHTISVNQLNSQTLRVLVFSSGNKNFTGNNGKVLSLDFSLKGTAGYYPIEIKNVVLANAAGENILSASYNGQLVITSPDIDAPTQLAFGDVAISSTGNQVLRISNYGQEPLTITQLMFANDYFRSSQPFPVTIQPSAYLDLPVAFSKTTEGAVTGTMKIISDDPDENPFTVQLSGNAFTPNYFQISTVGFIQGESKNVSVEIENGEPFVAFQFDLSYPVGLTPDLNAVALTNRKQDHVLSAVALSSTSMRILAYSPGQKTFTGSSGAVLNIPFKAEMSSLPGTYNLAFSNSMMSDANSKSILYAPKNGIVTIQRLNHLPVANAGIDQTVNEGATITLDGSTSADPDNDALTYKWTAPAGVTLSSTTAAKPTFTAPEVTKDTLYTFSLVVNDGTTDSPADQVVVTVKQVNKVPTANAGIDQTANEGAMVTLDGSTSADPDNDALT
ncbi:MAG: choice-of-anchor D domain-containing protein, partial [Bacteroidota bacterium]|nr:choice-of-anchor D domain-containing protein [Bacteroidota bacterium]